MKAHEQRHSHAKKNAEEREPKIVQADRLVVGAEDVAGQEASPRRFLVICSVVVVGHSCAKKICDMPGGTITASGTTINRLHFLGEFKRGWR